MLQVAWSPEFVRYNFGPRHPMSPVRLDLTLRLCQALDLLDGPAVRVVPAQVATDQALTRVHEPAYVRAVRDCSDGAAADDLARGLGTDDVPVFPGMHEASARIAQASIDGARAVWAGEADHAVNFAGGLHHAMPGAASGFCVYNDPALAIRALLEAGAARVAYVDVDVHHGDGVQAIFWDDARVLTISLHETGLALFPGSGFPDEVGGPRAAGSAVNVALPPGTGDGQWLRAFHSVVPQLLHAFGPQALVTQHGCDSHFSDPLAHLALSVEAQREAAVALHELAHKVCGGRWLALGGGGYEVVDVVPRTWSHLVAVAGHRPVAASAPVPAGWLEYVREAHRRPGPSHMGDGRDVWWRSWEVGYDPEDVVDRSIMATRRAVFPLHGLDPWFD